MPLARPSFHTSIRPRGPLSWNEIRSRAHAFARKFETAHYERGEANTFLIHFFEVFGLSTRRVARFEHAVKKHGGGRGYVDLFWPGVLLVEMKSRGKPLDRAYSQALDYFPGLAERDLPRYILVSDFARFELHDLEEKTSVTFPLEELHQNIHHFGFIAGYTTQAIRPQDPINVRAAEKMGELHDQLEAIGYTGHDLQLYLVRLLFCLFADDTGIFEKGQLHDYIENRTAKDGSDLGHHLATFFDVLNTPLDQRLTILDESLASFPYVNGKLFEERLRPAAFNREMRETLLDLCGLDWSLISPAIFGSLFQSINDKAARRNLGAHYTSEENILKLIKPLFLDELRAEFEKIRNSRKRLLDFHNKLSRLKFLDPACGCGNFLVITYRELRLLELDVLRALRKGETQDVLDVRDLLKLDVSQFYGIEIDEFPAQIAQVALWLTDHQMNQQVSAEFGLYYARIPLMSSPYIEHANALRTDWEELLPAEECSYILGNPPFVGAKYMDANQREDTRLVFKEVVSGGVLDLVAAWYVKAVNYAQSNKAINIAFVSTNSITQGEQVPVLWPWMLGKGVRIHFAHRTFAWTNEAPGKAAVHCIIIGFGLTDASRKVIYEYERLKGDPLAVRAKNINPYLVDAPNVVVQGRLKPISEAPAISNGSIPADGGNLILSEEERDEVLSAEPALVEWIRPYVGAHGFIRGEFRYCFWLVDCPPHVIRRSRILLQRVSAVKSMREASAKEATRLKAAIPHLFTENRQPEEGNYLAIPRTSSENRRYIPIGFLDHNVIAANDLQFIANADVFHFGIMSSAMHDAWVRATSGRLKSDIRYSVKFSYNTFPWPTPTDRQRNAIEKAAQEVLDARAEHPDSTLADLYDPLTMPPNLVRAHQQLDRAVDSAYRFRGKLESARVAFLFNLYEELSSLLPPAKGSRGRGGGRGKRAAAGQS